jgi:hypothetical protein
VNMHPGWARAPTAASRTTHHRGRARHDGEAERHHPAQARSRARAAPTQEPAALADQALPLPPVEPDGAG